MLFVGGVARGGASGRRCAEGRSEERGGGVMIKCAWLWLGDPFGVVCVVLVLVAVVDDKSDRHSPMRPVAATLPRWQPMTSASCSAPSIVVLGCTLALSTNSNRV